MSETTPQVPPAAPVNDSQRAYLSTVIRLTGEHLTALRDLEEYAASEIAAIKNATVAPTLHRGGVARIAGDVIAFRTELTTLLGVHPKYDLTEEQVRHAARLGAAPHGALSDGATEWLYATA